MITFCVIWKPFPDLGKVWKWMPLSSETLVFEAQTDPDSVPFRVTFRSCLLEKTFLCFGLPFGLGFGAGARSANLKVAIRMQKGVKV